MHQWFCFQNFLTRFTFLTELRAPKSINLIFVQFYQSTDSLEFLLFRLLVAYTQCTSYSCCFAHTFAQIEMIYLLREHFRVNTFMTCTKFTLYAIVVCVCNMTVISWPITNVVTLQHFAPTFTFNVVHILLLNTFVCESKWQTSYISFGLMSAHSCKCERVTRTWFWFAHLGLMLTKIVLAFSKG